MGQHPKVEEVALPGLGIKYAVATQAGRTVSIVTRRDGQRVLALHHTDDPDACGMTVALTDAEAEVLAEVLLRSNS